MALDESNVDATTTDRDSSGGIPPTPKQTAAISSTSSQKYISLQRNHSLSSARSTPSKSSNSSSNNGSRGRATTTTTTFPSSPALSTLSKNTFSSSGSSSSHARVNVDDILSNTKFKGRRKRSRVSMNASMRKIMGDNNHTPSDLLVNTANKKPMKVNSSNDIVGQKMSAHKSLLVDKTKSSQDVLGQEERKKRLERMQQEELQRRLELERNSKKSSIIKRQSSLERVEKIQNGLTKSDTQDVSIKLGGEALADDDNMTTSSRGSSGSSKNKRALREQHLQKEVAAEKSASDESPPNNSTSTRRSKRAKTMPSYNVTDLAKNNIVYGEIDVNNSSMETDKEGSSVITETMNQQKSVETNTERQLLDEDAMIEEPQETEEPDSIHSALSTLLVKYNSCIKGGGDETTTPSKETMASPWNVVQLLVAVLRYINLLDPESFNSSEHKEVEHGLANVLKSVERMKWEVMNRNTSNRYTQEQGSDDQGDEGELVTKKEARLLQMIQIQVWMRMMVWSLEEEHGWEFLKRVTALSDAKQTELDGMDNVNSKGKGSKKKKKSKKKSKSHDKQPNASPRDSLVEDVRLLIELAPYVLPPSLDFAQWLKDTLTLGFRQPIPDYGTELFDHFEIELAKPIALKRSGTDTSRCSELSEVSHSPVKGNAARKNNLSITTSASPKKKVSDKRNKRQQAYFASLATEEEKKASSSNSNAAPDDETATITGSLSTVTSTSKASSIREKDDTILLKTSVSLTATVPAKKSNPFLKDSARGSYIGSHFSSKLSNISTLFREVKVPSKPKQAPKPIKVPQRKQPSKHKRNIPSSLPRQLNVKASASATSTSESEAVPAKQKRKFPATSSAKNRLLSSSLPTETPCKRLRPAISSFRTTVKETPLRPIIEETPAKKNAATQHLRFRDGLNSIVEETPQPQQQQSLLRGGASVLPTNLWSQSGRRPPQPRAFISSRSAQRQQKRTLTNSIMSGNEHLSPVVDHQQFTPATLKFGLSPLPHKEEDMACVMAKAAKSAASRKRK